MWAPSMRLVPHALSVPATSSPDQNTAALEYWSSATLPHNTTRFTRHPLRVCRRDLLFLRQPPDLRRLLGLPAPPSLADGATIAAPLAAGAVLPAAAAGAAGYLAAPVPGSNIRPPAAYNSAGGKDGADAAGNLKQLSPQLGLFINSLPAPQVRERSAAVRAWWLACFGHGELESPAC